MKFKDILFFFILMLAVQVFASGESLTEKLTHQGFKCEPHGTDGHICITNQVSTQGFKYSQPVLVYVPKDVQFPDETLVHLHGFRGVCNDSNSTSPKKMFDNFNFAEQLKEAGRSKSIFVMPMSRGKCETYNSELATTAQAQGFFQWMKEMHLTSADESFVLSGHSGAGKVMGNIVSSQASKIRSAVMLDATYFTQSGYLQKWKTAIRANPSMVVHSVVKAGTVTDQRSSELKKIVGKGNYERHPTSTKHCDIPRTEYGKLLKQELALSPGGPSIPSKPQDGSR